MSRLTSGGRRAQTGGDGAEGGQFRDERVRQSALRVRKEVLGSAHHRPDAPCRRLNFRVHQLADELAGRRLVHVDPVSLVLYSIRLVQIAQSFRLGVDQRIQFLQIKRTLTRMLFLQYLVEDESHVEDEIDYAVGYAQLRHCDLPLVPVGPLLAPSVILGLHHVYLACRNEQI